MADAFKKRRTGDPYGHMRGERNKGAGSLQQATEVSHQGTDDAGASSTDMRLQCIIPAAGAGVTGKRH